MKKIILSLALLIAPFAAANAYISITPSSIEFGSVQMGSQAMQMFTINNMGSDDVRLQGCSFFTPFQCQLNCFGTLYSGQTCSGVIYFRPQTERYEFQTGMINTSAGSFTISAHGFGKI